jgi:hypothetical protein
VLEEAPRPAQKTANSVKKATGMTADAYGAPEEDPGSDGDVAAELLAPPGAARAEPLSAKDRFLEAHGDFADKARRFIPMFELGALYMPEGEVRDEQGEFELRYYKFDGLAPIPVGRDTFLLVGALAAARDYDFEDVIGADDDILYSAALRLGAGYFFNDDLVGQAYWQPSLYSDLDGTLNSRDWRLWYGAALLTYRLQDDLFLKGGVLVTDVADTGALPLIGVSWIFLPAWRLDILIPRVLEVSWGPIRVLNVHVGLEIEPEEFHIRYKTPGGEAQTDVHVQDIRAYIGAIYRITDNFSVFVKGGSTVGGYYDWRDADGKYDGTLEPSLFVQAGFGLSF